MTTENDRPTGVTRERRPALREIARERAEAMQRRQPWTPVFLNNEAESEFVRGEVWRLIGNANSEVAESFRAQRDDFLALGEAHIRREHLVTHKGAFPEGDVGDALRALDGDSLQVFQLRNGLKGDRRLTWAEVAERFRSARKPGKRYTRARVQQIYSKALEEFPPLADFAQALQTKSKVCLDREPDDDAGNEVPGAFGTHGRLTASDAFDMEELSPEREGGPRFGIISSTRNREI